MAEVYVASLSYGKDSIAMLEAIKQLGWPLDRIVHAEIWATDEISADLPPMVEFKSKADAIIKERYGIEVEHICAMTTPDKKYPFTAPPLVGGWTKLTYQDRFYTRSVRGLYIGNNYGFPTVRGGWCKKLKYGKSEIDIPRYILSHPKAKKERHLNRRLRSSWGGCAANSNLKRRAMLRIRSDQRKLVQRNAQTRGLTAFQSPQEGIGVQDSKRVFSDKPTTDGEKISVVQYLGLAMDEPERVARYQERKGFKLPLVEIGWDEAYCRKWCEENDLLSPIYTTATRGGVGFVITNRSDSFGCYARTTLTFGHCL